MDHNGTNPHEAGAHMERLELAHTHMRAALAILDELEEYVAASMLSSALTYCGGVDPGIVKPAKDCGPTDPGPG